MPNEFGFRKGCQQNWTLGRFSINELDFKWVFQIVHELWHAISIGNFVIGTKPQVSKRHNDGDGVFQNMATLFGTHQTYIGYIKITQKGKVLIETTLIVQKAARVLTKGKPQDLISCTRQWNKLTKGKLSQWKYSPYKRRDLIRKIANVLFCLCSNNEQSSSDVDLKDCL